MLRLPHRSATLTRVLVVMLAVGFIAGSAGAAGPVVSSQTIAGANTVSGGNLTAANTTTPHENPDTVTEDGDPEQIAAHLSGRLGTLLEGSSQNITAGEYDQARALVGDEYDELLSQYVTVAGETGQADSAEAFASVQNETAELITLREEFDATRAEYEEAVAEGDTQRARQLARELARLADEIDGVAVQLDRDLDTVENASGSNLDAAQTDVETIQLAATETATTATQAELTTTNITATTTPSTFSFQNATQITGTLRTANGTPIRNETVTIQVGERSYDVETDAAGNYTISYQPVFLPANATRVPVAFQPADTSPYLGANTTAPAQLTGQTTTTLTVTTERVTGNYRTPLQVAGTVTVGNNSTVAGVPVVLLLDGQQIGTGETEANGEVTLAGAVPQDAASGATPLQVRVPLNGTAVTGSTTMTTAEITSIETQVSVEATVTGTDTDTTPQEAVLTGNLTLADGSSVGGQSLGVFIGDQQVETITTAADGSYQTTIAAAAFEDATGAPTVRVVFTGSETHLAASESTVTLDTMTQRSSEGSEMSLRQLAGAGSALVLLGVVLILFGRATGWGPLKSSGLTATESSTAAADTTEATPGSSEEPADEITRSQQLLEDAFSALAADNTTAAIQLAYGSLRAALQPQVDASPPTTHWEFFNRCQDAGIDSLTDIQAIITAYETATFAEPTVSAERARAVLEQVADVIDRGKVTAADAQPPSDD